MSKTIGTSGTPSDIDGTIVDDAESLAQRIRAAYRFRLREWFLNPDEGLDYDLVFGHQISLAQTSQVLINVIREEGAGEILDIRDIEYSRNAENRKFTFSCIVDTIYGDSIELSEEFS